MESSQKKRRAMSTSTVTIQHQNVDRLSSLPDSLLTTIISFLPIESAASTSVLSRRWRNLWTHTTHLSVDDTFITALNHIVSQLQSSKIHTFDLHIPESCNRNETRLPSDFLLPCIQQLCSRNPEVFKVTLDFISGSTRVLEIPFCLFETRSLIELKLFANIQLSFLHTKMLLPYNLPNLKKLTLMLDGSNCGLIATNSTFFTACPLLEDLRLDLYSLHDALSTLTLDSTNCLRMEISAPNLKCFHIYAAINPVEPVDDCKIVIDAPKLEKCNISGGLLVYVFVSIPSDLQEVVISMKEFYFSLNNVDYKSKLPGLIQGISCAKSLVFEDYSATLLDYIGQLNVLPLFHNLTHFRFFYHVDYTISNLPACFLLCNLKTVDITGLGCDDCEFDMIRHVLCNATALEHLQIFTAGCYSRIGGDRMRKEYGFCKKLLLLPKSSATCLVKFYGEVITASSEDYADGVLSCQIRDHKY